MSEARKDTVRVDLDRSANLKSHGSIIISDGGLLAYRELDEVFTLTLMADDVLADLRTGRNFQHSSTALSRQSIYCRLEGYDDTNDAGRLSVDPVVRQVVGGGQLITGLHQPARCPLRGRSAHAAAELISADDIAQQVGPLGSTG